MVMAGTITRRLKSTVVVKGKKNKFLQVAHLFLYPTIYLLEDYDNVTRHKELLAKGIYSLAIILESA